MVGQAATQEIALRQIMQCFDRSDFKGTPSWAGLVHLGRRQTSADCRGSGGDRLWGLVVWERLHFVLVD